MIEGRWKCPVCKDTGRIDTAVPLTYRRCKCDAGTGRTRKSRETNAEGVCSSDLICELEAELKSTIADEDRFLKGSPSAMWMEGYKDGLRFAIGKERGRSQISGTQRQNPHNPTV